MGAAALPIHMIHNYYYTTTTTTNNNNDNDNNNTNDNTYDYTSQVSRFGSRKRGGRMGAAARAAAWA